ncbi:MAG: protease inhibitor I42 family protein [Chitinophagaceae bacterium]|nr:protease inhibitor I42 family protein [Chitinophagaceae bacterium]
MKQLILLLAFYSCGTTSSNDSTQDSLVIKVGKQLDIKLEAVMGTGYSWALEDSSFTNYLSIDTSFVMSKPQEKEGAKENQVFRFTGLAKGVVTIHFLYRRPWEKDKEPADKKTFTITIE